MDTEGIRLFVLAADLLNISAAGRQLGFGSRCGDVRVWLSSRSSWVQI